MTAKIMTSGEVNATLCGAAIGVVIAAVVVHTLVRLGELPIVELEPDGTCVRVIAFEGKRDVRKDCGWEKGKRYHIRYVAPDATRPPGGRG